MKKLYLLLLVALCGAMISPAVAKKKNKKKASTEATTKKEKKETKYDKLFKDKKVTTAKVSLLFTSWTIKFTLNCRLR